ncbi:MAG: hypothetical protein J07HN4v3_02657 [Halonotius sp. J07HN4]|jgi:hypothetical protein|nr:MAG: hypothetical protein J07HN4v3_02657 [Halonotius sp. J07HN4]
MSKRVDELEAQVAELRAAVNGLTEELVETKDRVRKLEAEAADEAETTGRTETKNDDHVVVVENEQEDVDVATSPSDNTASATDEGRAAVEPEEPTEDEANESIDDIIVA